MSHSIQSTTAPASLGAMRAKGRDIRAVVMFAGLMSLAAMAMGPTSLAAAEATTVGPIRIDAPWVRPSLGNTSVSAAYMSIVDTGSEGDRLIEASSDVAEAVELHTHIKDGDVMKMRRVDAIEVPAGAGVGLEPGGHHVMLIGLKRRLTVGDEVTLTLTFERAGKVALTAPVEKRGPTRGSHSGPTRGSHDGHGQMKQGQSQ